MAIITRGGERREDGQVMTTMGLRDRRAPLCEGCGGRHDGLYTKDSNGKWVGAECAKAADAAVLRRPAEGGDE
jgi:hypothetical protein